MFSFRASGTSGSESRVRRLSRWASSALILAAKLSGGLNIQHRWEQEHILRRCLESPLMRGIRMNGPRCYKGGRTRRLRPRGFKRVNRNGITVEGQRAAAVAIGLDCQCDLKEITNLEHGAQLCLWSRKALRAAAFSFRSRWSSCSLLSFPTVPFKDSS